MKTKKIINKSVSLFLLLLFIHSGLRATEVDATISLYSLFNPATDMENGIKGTVNSGGKIEVKIYEKGLNVLVYHTYITSSSTTFTGIATNYNKSSLGSGVTYYPNVWNSKEIKTALGSVDRKKYDTSTTRPYPFLRSNLNLRVVITETNAQMSVCKIPGIGLIDRTGGNPLFHPKHFCHDLKNADNWATVAWLKMKQPDINKGSDLVIAAHRGIWGDNLGDGNPENSTAALAATKEYTPILESDIMITGNKELVVIHDYNLHRLTDYSGSNRDYLFNMSWSQLSGLHLRKRNMKVTDFKLLDFGALVDLLIQNQLVLTVDIKDIRARYDKTGNCVDNCDYDPKTHGEEAGKKIKDSWMAILKKCIEIAASKNALQYIAFKVPHKYSDMLAYVPDSTLSKVQFMPVIQPNRTDYLDFTDSWITEGGNRVIAYETNFKSKDDPYLKSFTRAGKTYQNFLHYVYERSGLRPGCYPEEPMGPKGIVNRWADWLIKDLRTDVRGDHYFLMTIPYGKIMVLTTDRPDIWQKISEIYNNKPN